MKTLIVALGAASLAALPALAVAGNPAPHHAYAAPHAGNQHAPMRPMMNYPQHHMTYAPRNYSQQHVYTMRHEQRPYSNPQVYRHPYNDNRTYYSNNRDDRQRDSDFDRDDRFRHRGYYDGGYYGPSVTVGYYGGGYQAYGDDGYPPSGYGYDDQGYAAQGQGYYDADQGYDDQGYAGTADGDGQDYGPSYGYDRSVGYDRGYDDRGYDQSPPASDCGQWVWNDYQRRWVWTYCNCPNG